MGRPSLALVVRVLGGALLAVAVTGHAFMPSPCRQNGGTTECGAVDVAAWKYEQGYGNFCSPGDPTHWYASEGEAYARADREFACHYQSAPGCPGYWTVPGPSWIPDGTCAGIPVREYRGFAGYYIWSSPPPAQACSNTSWDVGTVNRWSGPVCPAGWNLQKTCVLETQVCWREAKPEGCVKGNPCVPNSGAKLEFATDYTGGGTFPLELRRTYHSQGFYRPIGVSGGDLGMGLSWRLSYHRAVNVGSISTLAPIAYVTHADGDYREFRQIGGVWTGRTDSPQRLVELTAAGIRTGWEYMQGDDEVSTFDANGRLLAIRHRTGLTQTMGYDASGRLTGVTDSFGRQLAFAYDGNGQLATATDPDGRVTTYSYNARRDLTAVAYPDGTVRQYLYELVDPAEGGAVRSWLTGIVDENGQRFATYQYDASGRMTMEEHAGGANRMSLAYTVNANGAVTATAVTDALGTVRTYTFATVNGISKDAGLSQACPGCTGNTAKAIAYDANGNVSSRTDFNDRKVCYAYDLARNLETARVEGILAAESCSTVLATPPNRPDVRRVTTSWHPTLRLPATLVEPAAGGTRTTTFTYDAAGNLTQKTIVAPKNDGSGATVTRTWAWTYGTLGRVASATDPNGRVTTYAYYADNDPALGKRGQVQSITNPLGHVTQVTAYDAHGRPLATVDPNGVTTTLAYDLRGRLTERNAGGEATSYVYGPAGQLTGVVLPDASTLTYTYDAAHRLVRIADGLGSRIDYTLDAAGNRTQERVYDPGGTLARTRSRTFDALNRLAQDLGAQGQTTSYGYDGNANVTTSTDPLARTTTNAYDALNRLTQVLDPAGGITQYGYDAGGNLAQVTDPRGLATSYTYDGLGNLVTQVSPDTGTTSSTFDAAGNVVTRTDARGATASYTVDAGNRVTAIVYGRSGTPSETHTFTYDAGPYALGRLTQLADPAATTAWTYTPHGRVASKTQTTAGVARTLTYGYNAAGQLTTLTTPSGQQVGYAYLNNRIVAVTVNGTPLASGIVTTPFGPAGAWQWGNGRFTFRDFDQDGRLTRWTYRNGADLLRRDLAFDAASRITAIADPLAPARSGAYQYDALDRLTVAQQGSPVAHTWQYGYDALGNRVGHDADGAAASLTYGANTHRLQAMVGSIPAGYLNGLASVSFVYNNANRLVEVQSGGTLATLRPTGSGNPTPVAVYYVHADHLGTPRAITRPSDDAIVWRWDSAEPFGSNLPDENPSGQGTFTYHLRFPGQYYDAEIGTHYNMARDYDSTIGRYIESDPIGLHGGLNTYAYVLANPLRLADPTGLDHKTGRTRQCGNGCWIRIDGDHHGDGRHMHWGCGNRDLGVCGEFGSTSHGS